jgi:rhodanese-related sulfurtransferase
MPHDRRVSLAEAQALLAKGHSFIDVRSDVEFEQGHGPGAFNVPFMQPLYDELVPNLDFLPVMTAAFPKSTPLILGCHSGNRSRAAAALLVEAGYEHIYELSVGWDGSRDAFGRLTPGWSRLGLPIEKGAPLARGYSTLRQKLASK